MQAEFSAQPDKILYMPLPNGQADVWLRTNIAQATSETSEDETATGEKWTADEVYFRTTLSMAEIEDDFDNLFETYSVTISAATVTTEERLDAIEAAILELAEVVVNG